MKDSKTEASRWLTQSTADLEFAGYALKGGYFSYACFQSHQAAEKALKALHFGKGAARLVLGHSVFQLASEIGFESVPQPELSLLDQYYIPTRYPNGLPGGVPAQAYSEKQAREAITIAERILEAVRGVF